ncbi:hypothetical protein CFC21_022088 [Triticum aestivum]|uniref:F-box associated domain-containing protein n=2 Tax=Triticum aestivum TaxID=4565 RepID=A0A3B6C3V0_WHEAT|nr:uncharacterized protein LOC123040803 [Triticum aestivum]KAF7007121.1 hypothetical protein CFC21_022088 [Triticum aestivum]
MGRLSLNLIMHDLRDSIYSLYRMDIRHLFYETAEIAVHAAEDAKAKKKNKLSMIESWNDLRKPVAHFKASNFFTLLRENSIMLADSFGRTTLLDIDFKSVVPMPPMPNGKGPNCICFSIPNPEPLKSYSQCLFVLDLVPGSSTNSSSFEFLTYLGSRDSSRPLVSSHFHLNWLWHDLPVPAFAEHPANSRAAMNYSYMLLDSSTMCLSSSEEGIGTYTFDMVNHKWSRAGNWVLPFCGKAEYVPELKLWFALSPSAPHSLCALDFPAMDFDLPPDLLRTWDCLHLHDETPYKRHLVNLGSGKFCVVSFFKTFKTKYVAENMEDESAVFTGLEVRRCNNSEGAVRMIKHMSKRYTFGRFGIQSIL